MRCSVRLKSLSWLHYCVPLKSLYPFLHTVEILVYVFAYKGNPYIRYCEKWKYLYPLLRTMEIPVSIIAYNWIANENPHPQNPRVAAG